MKLRRAHLVLAAPFVLALLFVAVAAFARPGGGQSYSGGSHSSGGGSHSGGGGSGGGGGDASFVFFLIQLVFEYPAIGIPLLILVIVGWVVMQKWKGVGEGWSSAMAEASAPAPAAASSRPRTELLRLQRTDAAFSLVVFEDFVYFLYAELHRARGSGMTDMLTPYASPQVLASLPRRPNLGEVTGIIVGSLTYESVSFRGGDTGEVSVVVVVEANYVERYRPQGEQRFFVKERLRLARAVNAVSRPPDKARILMCTNCGAPAQNIRGATCTFCKTPVSPGAKDWRVDGLTVLEQEPRPPLLTSTVEEVGTNLPTIVSPGVQQSMGAISAKDPAFQYPAFEGRVRTIFAELQAGWTARNPMQLRPFLSDNLFQSQCVWLDLYRAAHAINKTDNAKVLGLELAACTSDAYFDAITVRLYAESSDYTVGEDGRLLSGDPRKMRRYSEYWTLIRGAQAKSASKGDRACPNCGAPLNINMTGNCQYCKAKVTSGEYDWVLSRIEQDEAYRG